MTVTSDALNNGEPEFFFHNEDALWFLFRPIRSGELRTPGAGSRFMRAWWAHFGWRGLILHVIIKGWICYSFLLLYFLIEITKALACEWDSRAVFSMDGVTYETYWEILVDIYSPSMKR
jgi:hypothetical protein